MHSTDSSRFFFFCISATTGLLFPFDYGTEHVQTSDQPGREGWLMTKKITSNMTRGGLDTGRWVDENGVQTTAPLHRGTQPLRRYRTRFYSHSHPHPHPLAVVMIGFSFLHSTLASESQIAAFELPLDLPCALTFPSRLSRGQPSTATMTIRS